MVPACWQAGVRAHHDILTMTQYSFRVTKPRTSTARELFGILGSCPRASAMQREWNAYFEREGIDAFMGRYPASVKLLPERLSEMFHFDRRAYIVCLRLQKAILSLLDALDSSAAGEGRADIVINGGGVITGYFLGDGPPENMYQRLCHGEVAD